MTGRDREDTGAIGREADLSDAHGSAESTTRLPLAEEELVLSKRTVETGRVRVQTLVEHEHVDLHDVLTHDVVNVERRPMEQRLDRVPEPRQEGDVLIVPVLEERLVVEKHLYLVEEIHIRRTPTAVPIDVPATRRVMRAAVEREDLAHPTIRKDEE